jgi:hypothetical protein
MRTNPALGKKNMVGDQHSTPFILLESMAARQQGLQTKFSQLSPVCTTEMGARKQRVVNNN